MSVVDVVTGPEIHAEHPCEKHLWESTVNKRLVVEETRSSFLVKVSVFEHWRVSVEILDSTSSSLGNRVDEGTSRTKVSGEQPTKVPKKLVKQ